MPSLAQAQLEADKIKAFKAEIAFEMAHEQTGIT